MRNPLVYAALASFFLAVLIWVFGEAIPRDPMGVVDAMLFVGVFFLLSVLMPLFVVLAERAHSDVIAAHSSEVLSRIDVGDNGS